MAASVACRTAVKYLKCPQVGLLYPSVQNLINFESVRHIKKHWDPKFKRLRREKVVKVKLPDYEEDRNPDEKLTEEKIRSKLRQQGLQPPRPWVERSFYLASTAVVFEPYIPPEGDGKLSIVSGAGAKQKLTLLEKKSKSMMAVRKIRSFEEDFDPSLFANIAQTIYEQAHQYMAANDKLKLREVVTELCYPEIMHNVYHKTIHWKYLKSLEPPRVVHARCTNVITKDNIFGQVTVRFHSQQQLAVYDRFGRLMHGSEILAKDVLEYVVFEKHLANLYGSWRMHAKIVPDWMPAKEPSPITYIKNEQGPDVAISKDYDPNKPQAGAVPDESEKDTPQLATA